MLGVNEDTCEGLEKPYDNFGISCKSCDCESLPATVGCHSKMNPYGVGIVYCKRLNTIDSEAVMVFNRHDFELVEEKFNGEVRFKDNVMMELRDGRKITYVFLYNDANIFTLVKLLEEHSNVFYPFYSIAELAEKFSKYLCCAK